MKSTMFALTAALAVAFGLAMAPGDADELKPHRLAVQVSSKDPEVMAMALDNVVNVARELTGRAEEVEIEVVAYGPGMHMLRADTSPVAARVKSITQSMPYVRFTACGNTIHSMEQAEGKEIPLLPEVKVVQAGVVRLMELQEQGWSYVKP